MIRRMLAEPPLCAGCRSATSGRRLEPIGQYVAASRCGAEPRLYLADRALKNSGAQDQPLTGA